MQPDMEAPPSSTVLGPETLQTSPLLHDWWWRFPAENMADEAFSYNLTN